MGTVIENIRINVGKSYPCNRPSRLIICYLAEFLSQGKILCLRGSLSILSVRNLVRAIYNWRQLFPCAFYLIL
jgi:hypothetical protein